MSKEQADANDILGLDKDDQEYLSALFLAIIIFISIVLEKNQLRKGIEFLIKFEYYSLEFG